MDNQTTPIEKISAIAEMYRQTQELLYIERLILVAWPTHNLQGQSSRPSQVARVTAIESVLKNFEENSSTNQSSD